MIHHDSCCYPANMIIANEQDADDNGAMTMIKMGQGVERRPTS